MPATPKPPGQRVRRNVAQPEWRRLEADHGVPVPDAPEHIAALPAAADWWARVWSSPMAATYLDADHLALARAAVLHAVALGGAASSSDLAELRQLEDRFGLSPLARRRLQWEVAHAEPSSVPAVAASVSAIDRRRRLRAV